MWIKPKENLVELTRFWVAMNKMIRSLYPREPKFRIKYDDYWLTYFEGGGFLEELIFISDVRVNKLLYDDPDREDRYFEIKPDQLADLFLLLEKKSMLVDEGLVLREGDLELDYRKEIIYGSVENYRILYRLVNIDGKYDGVGKFERLNEEKLEDIMELVKEGIEKIY